jgi:predicted protein tyrosine phosphatase
MISGKEQKFTSRPETAGQGIIFVSGLNNLSATAKTIRAAHLVSLVPDYEQPPTPSSILPNRHLRLELDDIDVPIDGLVLPQPGHVAELIEFVQSWEVERPMLIHCAAGVSRSMAAAFVSLCLKSGAEEMSVARYLRNAAPHARPNRRIIALADEILEKHGRFLAALDSMGEPQTLPAVPFVRLALAFSHNDQGSVQITRSNRA